jgi:carboxymethylenebutenolidase
MQKDQSIVYYLLTGSFIVCFICGINSKSFAKIRNLKGELKIIMRRIKGRMAEYPSGDDSVSAYLAVPEGKGPFPALIVIHEWWGLNEWVKKNADEFADSGYSALAIDLYHGKSTTSPEEARVLSSRVDQERAATDLRSAFNYLSDMKDIDSSKIGSIGWCMGGGYSLKAALGIPELAVCIISYGRLVSDTETLKNLKCSVLGIFGENDQNITPDDVGKFEKSLNEAGVRNKIVIYPGAGHAFMNPGNKNLYNKMTAEKAWEEIYSFLNNNLKNEIR